MLSGLFRSGWWPGLPPTVDKPRVMCVGCRYHGAAMAGWQWDRCEHPEADYGSVVRNDQQPTCADVRLSQAQCGPSGRWRAEIVCRSCKDTGKVVALVPSDDGKHVYNQIEERDCPSCRAVEADAQRGRK